MNTLLQCSRRLIGPDGVQYGSAYLSPVGHVLVVLFLSCDQAPGSPSKSIIDPRSFRRCTNSAMLCLFGKRAVTITTATRRQGSHNHLRARSCSTALMSKSELWLIDSCSISYGVRTNNEFFVLALAPHEANGSFATYGVA